MPEPEKPRGGLPDILRNSDRPIIIYEGGPAALDVGTNTALGLLSWLALLSVCLGAIGFCAWQLWNPGYDRSQFSPLYAQGRPLGLARQIEEREQVNQSAEGLLDYLDSIRADVAGGRRPSAVHPLMSDRGGIDDLRRQWDETCLNIRARIYDRRIGRIEFQMSDLRAQVSRERDAAERNRLRGELRTLEQERDNQQLRRRYDTDPTLRCVSAQRAPVCSESSDEVWCNPQLKRPREFVSEVPQAS